MFAPLKNYLNRDFTPVYSDRKSQILHTRLRTNCGSLFNDLFLKNISESPLCSCGSVENTQHFFLRCPRYIEHRTLLLNEVSKHQPVSLNLLLYGSTSLPYETNVVIFKWYISTYQTLSVLLNIHLNCSKPQDTIRVKM